MKEISNSAITYDGNRYIRTRRGACIISCMDEDGVEALYDTKREYDGICYDCSLNGYWCFVSEQGKTLYYLDEDFKEERKLALEEDITDDTCITGIFYNCCLDCIAIATCHDIFLVSKEEGELLHCYHQKNGTITALLSVYSELLFIVNQKQCQKIYQLCDDGAVLIKEYIKGPRILNLLVGEVKEEGNSCTIDYVISQMNGGFIMHKNMLKLDNKMTNSQCSDCMSLCYKRREKPEIEVLDGGEFI